MRPVSRSLLAAVLAGSLALMLTAAAPGVIHRAVVDLPAQLLPTFGGTGGSAFNLSCGAGRVLTGLQDRVAFEVDAVGVLCRPINADGTLGSETTVGGLVGGGGGTAGALRCDTGRVVAGAYIAYGWYVDGISLKCRPWNAETRSFGTAFNQEKIGRFGAAGQTIAEENCEAGTQPAHAIRGRAHSLVDAFGLICDEP